MNEGLQAVQLIYGAKRSPDRAGVLIYKDGWC